MQSAIVTAMLCLASVAGHEPRATEGKAEGKAEGCRVVGLVGQTLKIQHRLAQAHGDRDVLCENPWHLLSFVLHPSDNIASVRKLVYGMR